MGKTWIQVVGTFNRVDKSGQFVAVQSAQEYNVVGAALASELKILVETKNGRLLATVPVTPEFGSCGDVVDEGTFQAFFELPDDAKALRLTYDEQELATYTVPVDRPGPAVAEALGFGPRNGHVMPLTHDGSSDPDATYTLQAREKGTLLWQTLDIGLNRPDAGQVDLNQFPNALGIEVRVLKSSGFETKEIDKTEIDF